jgi:hypothetical protein
MQSSLSIGAGCPKSFTGLCPDVSQTGQASRSAAQHPWLGRDPDKDLVAPAAIMLRNAKSPGSNRVTRSYNKCIAKEWPARRRSSNQSAGPAVPCGQSMFFFIPHSPDGSRFGTAAAFPFCQLLAPRCTALFSCLRPDRMLFTLFWRGAPKSDDFHLSCCSKRSLLLTR